MKRFLLLSLFFLLSNVLADETVRGITLKESLALAKKNNPFYLAEQYNLAVAKGDVTTAKLLPNPIFNNQMIAKQNGFNDFNILNPLQKNPGGSAWNEGNRQDWLQLKMKIHVAGQSKNSIELAIKILHLSEKNLAEYERNLLYLVANKWIDVWFIKERLNIITRSKQYSDELLKINEIRLRNQVITQAEFFRTQNIGEQYEANLAAVEQIYKNETRNLEFLIGSENPIQIAIEDTSISYNSKQESFDTLYKYAESNRSDIIANKVSQEAALTNAKLQEAYAYPQPELGVIYNPQNTQPYMGTFVTIPIPINNRNQGEIQKSQAQVKQIKSIQDALEKKLKAEIQNALGEYDVAKINFEKYKKIFHTTEKVLETVKYSYLKGGTTIIDYLDAQRSWFDAQNLYYESIFNLRKTFIQLEFVTGKIQTY